MSNNNIRMPERLKLDFNLNTPITSYNYTSFIGGVIFANNKMRYPYYLSNHIQLVSNDIFDVSCEDMLMFEDKNVFEDKKINKNILGKEEIKEDIIKMLNKGYYASVTVDEYDIPNRIFFNKMSFYHDLLILGYDLLENTFLTAGYDKTDHFNIMKCDIDIVIHSISKCLNEKKTKPHFHYFKCKENNLSFNIESVKSKLEKYISGVPLTKRKYHGEYGLNAYTELINKYMYACKNKIYWRKASFSMLCEHKKLMLERVKYINTNCCDIDNDMISQFEEIYQISKIVQISALKYEMTKSEGNLMSIVDKIKEISEKEEKSIIKLLEAI